MSPSNVEQAQAVGVTEACKYNDHSLCNGAGGRCGCTCHSRPAQEAAQSVPAQVADGHLTKACPNCNIKRPAFERFCRMCGAKLGSVQCPGCNAIADPEDKYCFQCGMPMKGEARRLADETAKQPQVATVTLAPVEADAGAEANVLKALQEAQRAGSLETKQDATPAEQTFSLPSGTFKTTTRAPAAGRLRENVPFKP